MNGGTKVSLQLSVANLGTTEAFYAGILELPVQRAFTSPGSPELLAMENGDWEIIFVEDEAVLRAHPVFEERFGEFPRGVGLTLHFRVHDIDGIYEALLDEELDILYPLAQKPYGMKELWCFDPDGYLVVLEEPTR